MMRNLVQRTPTDRMSRRIAVGRLAGAGAAIALATGLGPIRGGAQGAARSVDSIVTTEGAHMSQTTTADQLTVVLVHGAFADASSWNGVTELLEAAGVQVVAPANPLRGIAEDSAYTASYLSQIPGPVLAVGHSYGGATISNAATNAKNVVGLVFVAAFAPEDGEVLGEVEKGSKDSILNSALVSYNYPTGQNGKTAVEYLVNPTLFPKVFAGDLPEKQANLLSAGQRPAAEACFAEANGAPAWKNLPSWTVVATGDKAAGADVIRSMAKRAGATITEIEGSHLIMVSQPQAVTDVIMAAIEAV